SLAWSVHLTANNPAAAYFVTTTRIWELALGGAIAVLGLRQWTLPRRLSGPVALLGLAAVLVAVLAYSSTTPFPGAAALLPTLGTAAVILARAPERSAAGRVLGLRGAQLLGDVSYSTYLWHWPLIVLLPFAVHRALSGWQLAGVAVASIGLAWLTKRFVEDPARRSALLNRSALATTALLVVCTATGALAGAGLQAWAADRSAREIAAAEQAVAAHPECLAATGLLSGEDCTAFDGQLWTPAVQAAQDKPRLYEDGCWNEQPYATRTTCTYGPDDATVRIALVGNSHAGHWFPPVEQIAEDRGWQVTTYLASACYPVDVDLAFSDEDSTDGCSEWNAWVRGKVATGGYDVVVLSARTDQHLADVPREQEDAVAQEAYARVLDGFTDLGAGVVVIRDTPNFPGSVPDCVGASPSQDCTVPRAEALEVDPLALAAASDGSGRVALLDASDLLCDSELCHGVLGNAIVMFDHGHLTATFSRSLRPLVEPALDDALRRAG
ncbi:acyltransferase family protein, partial [Actinotalea sp.]|uniref:acyltransferase family protein n=1 Tax=Actinotalea sp. TaxID=1872145 RepID=UPI003565364F